MPEVEQTDICDGNRDCSIAPICRCDGKSGADGCDVQSALHFASDFAEVEVARKGNNGSTPNKNWTV